MPELLSLSAIMAREKGWRLVTHVAESDQEFEMFMQGRGEMFDWLRRNERDMSDCGLGSPVQHLEHHGYLANNLIAVHVNYLAPGDALLLERRGVSVAHCPRSHAFFQHRRFPQNELVGAGVNLCLGTDSLASVTKMRGQPLELNLFTEMQSFASAHPDAPPETIVRMATLNGARALGMQGTLGELAANVMADLITVPYNGHCAGALEAVVHHKGDVAASMIDGEWAKPPAT
jgi:cytosine/adenosine deaminase-related metal-dependent hydrolase